MARQSEEIPPFEAPADPARARVFGAPAGVGRALLDAGPEQREHRANVIRLRTAATIGVVVWLLFAGVDWLMTRSVYPGRLWPLLAIRFACAPLYVLFIWRLGREPYPGPRVLRGLDIATFGCASVVLAVIAMRMGGLAGPYTPGVFLVLICRNAFLIQSWRQSLLPNASVVLIHFATLGVGEWLLAVPASGGAAHARLALAGLHFASLTAGAVLLSAASHTAWALQRRVFAARRLGQYRLIERIGEGGHGEVWSAYHAGLRRRVAIKVLRREIADDERALNRFEREIDALMRLRHPHTIRILDCGVAGDGVCYYAMELLDGVTLAELVSKEGPLAAERVVHIVLQAARALAEAHQRGIVHRDIKPENAFVLRREHSADFVKLLDFGIAKRHASVHDEPITRTGMVVGTPAFMAPEVARGACADYRSDVYGLGATAYFLLTGRAPFEGDASPALHNEPRQAAPPSELLGSSLVPGLEHVVLRCLSGEPAKRYQDAGELARALEVLSSDHPWTQPEPRRARVNIRAATTPVATRTQPQDRDPHT